MPTCSRCGRSSHTAVSCYASWDVQGRRITQPRGSPPRSTGALGAGGAAYDAGTTFSFLQQNPSASSLIGFGITSAAAAPAPTEGAVFGSQYSGQPATQPSVVLQRQQYLAVKAGSNTSGSGTAATSTHGIEWGVSVPSRTSSISSAAPAPAAAPAAVTVAAAPIGSTGLVRVSSSTGSASNTTATANSCSRCGRDSHTADRCYASKHANGQSITGTATASVTASSSKPPDAAMVAASPVVVVDSAPARMAAASAPAARAAVVVDLTSSSGAAAAAAPAPADADAEPQVTEIYVLELEGGYYYVGKSKNVDKRVLQHTEGSGSSAWTRKHPVVRLLERFRMKHRTEEDATTKRYMFDKGIDKVRGGTYSKVTLTAEELSALEAEERGANDKCYRCGRTGHFVRQCEETTTADGDLIPPGHAHSSGAVRGGAGSPSSGGAAGGAGAGAGWDAGFVASSTSGLLSGAKRGREGWGCCSRCGRSGHHAWACYASTHVSGHHLASERTYDVDDTDEDEDDEHENEDDDDEESEDDEDEVDDDEENEDDEDEDDEDNDEEDEDDDDGEDDEDDDDDDDDYDDDYD